MTLSLFSCAKEENKADSSETDSNENGTFVCRNNRGEKLGSYAVPSYLRDLEFSDGVIAIQTRGDTAYVTYCFDTNMNHRF